MDEIKELKNKLEQAYEMLQILDIKPIKTNMEVILFVMDAIQSSYEFVGRNSKEKSDDLEIERPEE